MSVIRMEKQNSKRKPLSNLTNTITPNPNSKHKPKLKSDTASTGSNTLPNPINQPNTQTPLIRRPPNPKLASSLPDSGSVNYETTVYARKQSASRTKDKEVAVATIEPAKAKDKGKTVATIESFSCPPIERSRKLWDDIEDEESDKNLSKICTDGGPRGKKKRYSMLPALPRDFVEEQRKYFAEVDAFQLEEEAVSESELE